MSIDWDWTAKLKACQIRIAELEERIASQTRPTPSGDMGTKFGACAKLQRTDRNQVRRSRGELPRRASLML